MMMNLKRLSTLGQRVLVAALAVACPFCSTIFPSDGAGEITAKTFGTEYKVGVRWGTSGEDPTRVTTLSNERSMKMCGSVQFLDENDKPLGMPVDVELPAASGDPLVAGQVTLVQPAGTKNTKVTAKDCAEDEEAGATSMQVGGRNPSRVAQARLETWHVGVFVSAPDATGSDVDREFQLRIKALAGADDRVDAITDWVHTKGLAIPIPDSLLMNVIDVEVIYYMEHRFDASAAEVELTIANDDAMVSLAVDLNGSQIGDIDSGLHYTAPNGWDAVSYVFPASLFAYDATSGASWTNALDVLCEFGGSKRLYPDIRYQGYLTYVSD